MEPQNNRQAISRREFVWSSLAAAAYFTLRGSAQAFPPSREAPAVHNCMLVGSQTAFLSHLPMFDHLNKTGTDYVTPHRFQMIARASFERNGMDLTKRYFAERDSHPTTKMFSVSPKPFVLPQLVAAEPLTSFEGTVFRGHLERGGERISGLEGISVRIGKVIHFHEFDPKAQAPEALEYFLFGRGKERFLAHSIVKPPDFDQILSVDATGGAGLTDEQLSSAALIRIPDRKNAAADRIKEDQQVTGKLPGGAELRLRALREFYFEEGELLVPPTFDATPEETKAGFSS